MTPTLLMRDYDRKIDRPGRNWEIAGGGGFITEVDGKAVLPPTSETTALSDDTDKRNVLIGYALLFNQIIRHGDGDGQLIMIRPTAFKDVMAGTTKHFLHRHDQNMRVASTKDNLTLHADDYGLAFKLYIPRTPLGRQTKNLVRTNVQQCMSANFTATEIERHTIDGNEIIVVHKADLHEVSLVESGANTDAFAVLVDDSAEWVTDMCKSLRMTDEMNRAHIRRAIRRLEAIS